MDEPEVIMARLAEGVDLAQARRHLGLGYRCASALPDDGYGRLIRTGLDRLSERLQVS